MFQLDDNFLQSVGLGELPEDQKQAFLKHIYEELELRVGTKLSEGLSDAQLTEFESFMNGNEQAITTWLSANVADYEQNQEFIQFKANLPEDAPRLAILSEFASLKWLGINRPDYKQVVAAELDLLKNYIIENRDSILGKEPA